MLGGICSPPPASSGSALLSGTSNLLQKWENQAATWLPSGPAAGAGIRGVPQASSRKRSLRC